MSTTMHFLAFQNSWVNIASLVNISWLNYILKLAALLGLFDNLQSQSGDCSNLRSVCPTWNVFFTSSERGGNLNLVSTMDLTASLLRLERLSGRFLVFGSSRAQNWVNYQYKYCHYTLYTLYILYYTRFIYI